MSESNQPIAARAERVEGEEPGVPLCLIIVFGLLVFWGISYLDRHGGWFNAEVFEPFASHEEVAACQPYDPEAAYLAIGKKTFDASCALCHQPNGQGKEGQFPPLDGSDWLNAAGPNRIGRIVLNGLGGSLTVQSALGITRINASMAPLGSSYTDEQLAAALTFVRQSWSNKSGKIKPEDIAKIRAAIKNHPGSFTEKELQAIPVQ